MFNFTPEEKRVVLFLFGLVLCGLALNNLVKINCRFIGVVYPQAQLARLDLNQVNLKELSGIKCIPVKLAQRIIEYRNLNRKFSSLEELKEIKGVGEARLEKLKEVFFIE